MLQMNEYKAIVLEGEDKEGALLASLLILFSSSHPFLWS